MTKKTKTLIILIAGMVSALGLSVVIFVVMMPFVIMILLSGDLGTEGDKELDLDIAVQRVREINHAVNLYSWAEGCSPSTLEELGRVCREHREWVSPLGGVLFIHLRDPWRNRYQLREREDGSMYAFSMGPDGIAGTQDDITGYDPEFDRRIAESDVKILTTSILLYREEKGVYPTTLEELTRAAIDYPDWWRYRNAKYPQVMDPWGNCYELGGRMDGFMFSFSKGPDGITETLDDITVHDDVWFTYITRWRVRYLNTSIALYRKETGVNPPSLEELRSEVTKHRTWWRYSYSPVEIPPIADPWGNDYQLREREDGSMYGFSMGPDGIAGTEDDITEE